MSSGVIPFIDLHSQYADLKPAIDRAIQRVLDHGQYIMGPEVAEMETTLGEYVGAECIAVASGTEALLISLMALGIGLGDEVITSPFTFAATAEVVALLGAVPVFVDVEPDTCNIDVTLIEKAISPRTRAIMPVSLYGQPADMDEIVAIGMRHGIPVIDDAAQSFGATYKGRRAGGLTDIGCTSFFPSKPLGCYGDGGALFTTDSSIANVAREIRVHGQSKRYLHTRVGVGGRMDTLQCAIILAKWQTFQSEIERRLEVGNRYDDLVDAHGIARVQVRADRTSVFAQYTVMLQDRGRAQEALKRAGIPTAIHYPLVLNEQPAFAQLARGAPTPVAKDLANRVLSLPMYPRLESNNQERIIEILAAAC